MFDVIIRNGLVLDGRGSPAVRSDIGILGGRIASVGDLPDATAPKTIDAGGHYVCPGFIDAHSHSDTYILVEPSAASKVFQGITTEVVGNCGASAAPLRGEYKMPSDWASIDYPRKWSSVAEYREVLDSVKPAVNIAMLIGHNTIRAGVAGYGNRPLSPGEMSAAEKLLDQALEEGGIGLSTGLLYPPGMFAGREEIVALARVVARRGGIYTSHMRSEGSRLLEAVAETIGVGREAGCRVEISHLKTAGRDNWCLIDSVLETIESAREDGVAVTCDRYPYTFGCTDLDVIFPAWAEEGGRLETLKRLRDPSLRARIREELMAGRSEGSIGAIVVGSTANPANRRFRGMPVSAVAAELGMHPVDAVLHLVDTDDLRTGAFFHGMSEDNMFRILSAPYVMLGTDASLRAPAGVLGDDFPHPRAYGSFPRFLRMVLDRRLLSLEEAIRKMTSLPAEAFGLKERGYIDECACADIVIFDPARIRDTADCSNPHSLAEGVDTLIVGGVCTILDGKLTGERGGQFIGSGE